MFCSQGLSRSARGSPFLGYHQPSGEAVSSSDWIAKFFSLESPLIMFMASILAPMWFPIADSFARSIASIRFFGVRRWLAALLVVLTLAGPWQARAELELSGYHDFGRLTSHTQVFHLFAIRNAGDQPLRVTGVRPTCECVHVETSPKEIPPHGEAPLGVRISAGNPALTEWAVWVDFAGECGSRLYGLSASVQVETNQSVNPDLLASASGLVGKAPLPSDVVLVDVRSPESFRQGRIAGALNLPLHTLKTKAYLKPKTVLLVNEGHDDSLLLAECVRLRGQGFARAQVLAGGLRAWQQAGGALVGQGQVAAAVATISEAQFYAARGQADWLVVRVLPSSGGAGEWFSCAAMTNFVFNPQTLGSEMAVAAGEMPGHSRCLILNETGLDSAEIEKSLGDFRALPVFYLAGGLPGYRQFLALQIGQLNRRQVTQSGAATSRAVRGPGAGKSGGCACGHK